MTIDNNDVKNRNDELNDRAKRDTIVHETVPGEDPIQTGKDNKRNDGKAAVSTMDEDTN